MQQPPAFSQGFNIQTRQMKVDEAQRRMQGICQQLFGLLFQFYTLPYSEKGEKIAQGYYSAKALFQQLQQDTAAFFELTDPQYLSQRKENEMNSCKGDDEEEEKLSQSMIDLDYIQVLQNILDAGYIDALQSLIVKQKALAEIINQISQKVTFSPEEQINFYGIQSFILGPANSRKSISLTEKNAFSSYFKSLKNELSQSLNKLTEICSYLEQEVEGHFIKSKKERKKEVEGQSLLFNIHSSEYIQKDAEERKGSLNTDLKHEKEQANFRSEDKGSDDNFFQGRSPKDQENKNLFKFEADSKELLRYFFKKYNHAPDSDNQRRSEYYQYMTIALSMMVGSITAFTSSSWRYLY